MLPFRLSLPTLRFGSGTLEHLGRETAALGDHALLVTGRSHVRRSGLLERAVALLTEAGVEVSLFERIEPNPRSSTLDEGARLVREEGMSVLVALGGGSVMDGAKGIAAAAASGRSVWDFCRSSGTPLSGQPVEAGMPIVAVPTFAGTGSEVNGFSVVTRWETHEKSVLFGPGLVPRTAIVDPALTLSVPAASTADGGVDMFCHIIESYLTGPDGAEVSDRLAESLMATIVETLPAAVANGGDLALRERLSWISTLALSGIPAAGRPGPFPVHDMEHALSGWYDIPHGRGLGILLPAYFRAVLPARPDRFARLARQVFGVTEADDRTAAEEGTRRLTAWLHDVGIREGLGDLGIPRDSFAGMAEAVIHLSGRGNPFIAAPRPLYREDVIALFEEAYESAG